MKKLKLLIIFALLIISLLIVSCSSSNFYYKITTDFGKTYYTKGYNGYIYNLQDGTTRIRRYSETINGNEIYEYLYIGTSHILTIEKIYEGGIK